MIEDARLSEIIEDSASATSGEAAELSSEVARWRSVNAYVHEALKAIYINAKEAAERSLELDVIASASRACMRRMKSALHGDHRR